MEKLSGIGKIYRGDLELATALYIIQNGTAIPLGNRARARQSSNDENEEKDKKVLDSDGDVVSEDPNLTGQITILKGEKNLAGYLGLVLESEEGFRFEFSINVGNPETSTYLMEIARATRPSQ